MYDLLKNKLTQLSIEGVFGEEKGQYKSPHPQKK